MTKYFSISRFALCILIILFIGQDAYSQTKPQTPLTEKEVELKRVIYQKEIDAFYKEHGLKSMQEVFMVQVKIGMNIFDVRDLLGKPDRENVTTNESGGDTATLRWMSGTKSLYVTTDGNRIDYVSIDGFSIETTSQFRSLYNRGRILWMLERDAEACLEAMERENWTYEKKPLEGKLIGWRGKSALFRINEKQKACDPSKFKRDEIRLLKGYFVTNGGKNNKSLTLTPIDPGEQKEN